MTGVLRTCRPSRYRIPVGWVLIDRRNRATGAAGAAGGGGGGGASLRRALSVPSTRRDVESPRAGVAPFAAELGRSANHAPAPTSRVPATSAASTTRRRRSGVKRIVGASLEPGVAIGTVMFPNSAETRAP